MKILFRCDSSYLIGSGHLVRCLNLANILKFKGHEIYFALRDLSGHFNSLVEETQFKLYLLPRDSQFKTIENLSNTWLGASMQNEIDHFQSIVNRVQPNLIVLDHYSLNLEWERHFRSQKIKICVIDDILREHECDILIDPNFQFNHLEKIMTNSDCKLFLGPGYCLLNPDFYNFEPIDLFRIKKPKNITIFFGGSDIHHMSLLLIQNIEKIRNYKNYHFNLILGKSNSSIEEINMISSAYSNLSLYIQTNEVPRILSKTDIFIGAGGTITWEKCYFGIPSICVAVAKNQELISQNLHQLNIHEHLGYYKDLSIDSLMFKINLLLNDSEKRSFFHMNSLDLMVAQKTNDLISFIESLND